MPTDTRELIAGLLSTRSAVLVDVETTAPDARDERLLVLSNLTGTMQLCELVDGVLHELTALPEAVSDAHYIPGPDGCSSRRAILSADSGGDERHQLYVVDLDAAHAAPIRDLTGLRALTADPAHGYHFAGISPDGHRVAYTSNRADGVDFDLWLLELESGEHRRLWAAGGWAHPASGFSPDGRWISVLRSGTRPLDGDLILVDADSGATRMPLPHPDEAALIDVPTWLDEQRFIVAANLGRDFMALVEHDLATDATTVRSDTGVDCDSLGLIRAPGGTAVLVENADCVTVLHRYDLAEGRGAPIATAEPGLCASYAIPAPRLSADGRRLYYTLTSPRLGADVHCCELETGVTRRLTHSPAPIPAEALADAELVTIPSFDGLAVQLIVYRPRSAEATPPVVVLPHGGPASQSWRRFDAVVQALCAAGFGVVVPNVRGSTGYGKRFAALDDTDRRLDSVADLGAIHGHLGELGFDPARAALWGGSYGGYMVLAGLTMQPELWAAGVDIVGIANLVTFLENTSAYRRANREAEYGALATDREMLRRISPMTHIAQLHAPMFVIHGANDPRVPVSEAIALEATLRERGIPCELAIYENEGHGLGRLENRLDAYPRAVAFLTAILSPGGRP